jgi:WD40 repeat protein
LKLSPPYVVLADAFWVDQGREVVGVTEEELVNPSHSPFPRGAQVEVWNVATGATRVESKFTFFNRGIWISPEGTSLAIETADQRLQFWSTASGTLAATTSALPSPAGSIAWSPDGAFLAVGENSATWPAAPGQVQIWSAATGKLVATLTDTDTFEGTIEGLAWSPNGQYLAESSGQIHIWSAASWQQVASFGKVVTRAPQGTSGENTYSMIDAVAWSPDGTMLASVTRSFALGPHTSALVTEQTLYTWQLA